MKISYNWIKQYLNINETPEKISEILTDIGLEVEGVETFQSVKGGLEGLVIGKVLTREKHPNADKLSKTTVDIGNGIILPIVCGAPNVDAGQTVVVATVGTTLYDKESEFVIKKSKIRGEVSAGMICAEDEIGLGTSHDGIMVLPNDITAGTLAKAYFKVENDTVFEIGLTPNRIDAASHIGVARDLKAYFSLHTPVELTWPDISNFKQDNSELPIDILVENKEACPRYTGLTISNVTVAESPNWLKVKLKSIGLEPINNIVDITNFILHEMGQPLHAFDYDKLASNKIIVKNLPDKTKFITLDEEERSLSSQDLMICDEKGGLCIAGVFGGLNSGITNETKNVFLESAYFNPVSVRKTAKQHQLSTDASFRFERGIDPNIADYALKRAALLIKEVAGGNISSKIIDSNPEITPHFEVSLTYSKIRSVIGKDIDESTIDTILQSLEISVSKEGDKLHLKVPPYRVDVQRAEDIIEDILRLYGYNNVEIPSSIKSSIIIDDSVDDFTYKNTISDILIGNGFVEMWSNSLSKQSYYNDKEEYSVKILNPLSADLNTMRQTLLFGGLEAIAHNANRQKKDLKLFEFGKAYYYNSNKEGLKKYAEEQKLAIFITGNDLAISWNNPEKEVDFYTLKGYVGIILKRLGIKYGSLFGEQFKDGNSQGLLLKINNKDLCKIGLVSSKLQKQFDIDSPVYYCEMNWDYALKVSKKETTFEELPKFPEVKRDLSLLLDEKISFETLKEIAFKTEKKLLKEVSIFDIYQGEGIEKGKKSYAISVILQNDKSTLNDKQIDKIMDKLINAYKSSLNAELR